ncbi:hypothetical protein [Armatimonas sp.]|uniref:hypothetical protein n=1 Tax=Armatimonas sp. TaxID=1872638 RepID=UPI003752D8C2
MKNIALLATTILLALSLPAHAQKPDKQARKADRNLVATANKATPDRSQLATLVAALHSLTLSDAQRTKLEAVALKLEADILATLTPDQQAQFKEALTQTQKGDKTQEKREKRGPFADLLETLALSPEQSKRVDPIVDSAQKKLTELTETRNPDARKDPTTRKDLALKNKAIMDDVRAQLRPLLNPSQQALLDAWKGKGKN